MSIAGSPVAQLQRRAADPARSVWVAASAGAGKTQVLTDRVLSLLLAGTDPGRILCLTFTKAAAAEMTDRIADRLGQWATCSDFGLARRLVRLTGRRPTAETCRRARRLFARVLDAPGGMKIQTVHAFCQALLRRFPIEAGVAPHFEVLEERTAAELLVAAREEVLSRALTSGDGAIAAALAAVTAQVDEAEFFELIRGLAVERARLSQLLERFDGVAGLVAAIRERVGLRKDVDAAALRSAACADDAIDLLGLRLACQALVAGKPTDQKRGAAIAAWLSAPELRPAGFDDYADQFLVKASDGGCKIRSRLITKGAAAQIPGVERILDSEAERLLDVVERIKSATIVEATAALLTLGTAMLECYQRDKDAHARLDFDDLILKSRDLLGRPGVAPWVLYKLDGGLDHILIDEAQDTSPAQWQVVADLAAEFFAGEGARPAERTVFAVGDVKQSIFSFQGADPEEFERMRRHFRQRIVAARQAWEEVPLDVSFRSVPAVLAAIDAVFALPSAHDGVALDGRAIRHRAFRDGAAGVVELWPACAPQEGEPMSPWAPPIEQHGSDSPRFRLARLIAHRVATMIERREMLPARGRAVQPGDIMVLVRRRDELVEELVRELKQRRIPVAGIDRMRLSEQIAVMDLLALGRFLLLPEDDLTLATVLRSPLVGLDEDELFDLAHRRGDRHLWDELRRRRSDKSAFRDAEALLGGLLARADFTLPYELYAELLGPLGGRRRLVGRLGREALDPIDELMALALRFERDHVPSLQAFLHWLDVGDVEVKRDLEQDGGGQVRVMTVHGAKGLQAPIVFLPDTMQTPRHAARLLWHGGESPAAPSLPIWSPRIGLDDAVARDARARERQAEDREHRRLLYVAMTRAEDRLYVCGWRGRQQAPGDCWYNLVAQGLEALGEAVAFDFAAEIGAEGWIGPGRRIVSPQTAPRVAPAPQAPEPPVGEEPLWLRSPPPRDPLPPRPLAPSRIAEEPPVRPPLGSDGGLGFQRGRIIHRLLEILPDVPPPRRAEACRRFLARPAHSLSAVQQAEIAIETLRILEDPVFAPLFGPDSLAEVPVVGAIAGADGHVHGLSGRLDRLLVAGREVLVVDFKTNRPAPASEADVPAPYMWQLAAYRAALSKVYPGYSIRCALLWTAVPRLMPIAADRLDRYVA